MIGRLCIVLDTGFRGLVVAKLSRLGEADRYAVRLHGGEEEWFEAYDLEFL
ncbi:hypothetical protein [Mesorhizobium sp. 1M-11]|uniref:hypothetical protein n=1 Tax=Mesorhizobium sp. 1M-11 TaxID=1529006 RepID=UPI000ABAE8A4|nr:hypothetical protein [Mesorhizobium sp. 1M-11]